MHANVQTETALNEPEPNDRETAGPTYADLSFPRPSHEWHETRSLLWARQSALTGSLAESRLWAATLVGWCVQIDELIKRDMRTPATATLHDDFLHDAEAIVARTNAAT